MTVVLSSSVKPSNVSFRNTSNDKDSNRWTNQERKNSCCEPATWRVLIKINTDWAALRKQSGAKHSVTRVQRPLVHSAAAEVPYEWGMRRSDG
ncbi:hypothetical protein BDV32DRAFT_124684 [Aspergillus pseudonomiae]|nr:hypothetical protein BDV32DRAFT_124684 [Aspergillus pseudonomiae]